MSGPAQGGRGRRLVLLFDGTWNRREHTTSVWRTRLMLEASEEQLVYYDQGVGTDPGEKIGGGAIGTGLSRKTLAGYLWLMENYRPAHESPQGVADEIFILGFSRGAFTARSLTGLLGLCGLLRRAAPVSVQRAFDLSRIEGLERNHSLMKRFRRRNSHKGPVRVKFLGVWDTVGALGVPKLRLPFTERYAFHKVELQQIVEHARQALALDERRRLFAPAIWPGTVAPHQTLEQRWFTGSHANVGGGYARDGLPMRPLQWMVDEAASHGLVFRSRISRLTDAFYASLPRDPLDEIGLGIYYLTQGFKRMHREVELGTASRQTVDYTVLERWLWDHTYEVPPSLERALLRKGPRQYSRSVRLDDGQIATALGDALVPGPTRGFS